MLLPENSLLEEQDESLMAALIQLRGTYTMYTSKRIHQQLHV